MKNGAAYIRVSTDMQTELSPDSQLKLIKDYAKRNDIILSTEHIFQDDGISGKRAEKRPEFMRMIATAKTKPRPFDVILVWKFSRFARNRQDSIVYKSMLRKDCGIDVVSISEPIGEDKTSILIEALLEAMDEYYSLNLAEEVRRGMVEKVARGGIVVAPPFGYIIKDGIYQPEPTQAEVVKTVFSRFLDGTGTRTIAADLNELNIKTRHGHNWENRTIDYMLQNPTYIGKLRFSPNGKATASHNYRMSDDTIIVDGQHEAIIDKETFAAVQELIAKNRKKYPKNYNQRKENYFFRGIVRCSSCGSTLCQNNKGKSLQCHAYAKGSCKVSHNISIDKLRAAVIEALTDDAESKSKLNFVASKKPARSADQSDLIRDQIRKEEQKLERIRAAYEDGIDTLEEYKANKLKINAAIEALNKKMQAVKPAKKMSESAFRERISETLKVIIAPDVTAESFNDALLDIVDKIVFDRSKSEVVVFYKIEL